VYAPGSFANTQEIIDLAIVAKNRGGLYASHIRDERQDLEDAIEEAIEIGRQAGIPVLVSHLKAAEKPNWGKIPRVIRHIENARAEGISVSFEVYPYTAVSTKLRSYLPKDILQDGLAGMVERLKTESWSNRSINWLEKRGTDFDNMVVISDRIPAARGRSIGRVARGNGRHPAQVAIDILILDPDAWMVYDCISEEDMDLAVLWPESIICSDSWSYPVNAPVQIGNPHPRTYGAFTRFLERYVLGRQEISFGQAVKKVSTYAADWLGFTDRGRIREGFAADIVILDPENVHEKATYEEPRQYSEGTEYVWVNGKMVINCSLQTDELPGTVLTRQDRSIPC